MFKMTGSDIGKVDDIDAVFDEIGKGCTRCSLCQKECRFLQTYGLPGDIPEIYRADKKNIQNRSFECSLCGLCTAVCPEGLDPAKLFLELRRDAVRDGRGKFKKHAAVLNYEKRGRSQRYSLYMLPDNCNTVFFPGCTLPGTRPAQTFKTIEYLQKNIPALGVVLDCCMKPSHDLGRQKYFLKMLSKLTDSLEKKGVKNIIVACPNCYKVFSTYAPDFNTTSVYEELDQFKHKVNAKYNMQCSLHDPCVTRFIPSIQQSVRNLAVKNGMMIKEMKLSGTKTVCCGEGGAVACVNPEFSSAWTEKRTLNKGESPLLSYCAGCINFLGKKNQAFHILDYLFAPEKMLAGKLKVYKAPFTYLNRLLLKRRITNNFDKLITKVTCNKYGKL